MEAPQDVRNDPIFGRRMFTTAQRHLPATFKTTALRSYFGCEFPYGQRNTWPAVVMRCMLARAACRDDSTCPVIVVPLRYPALDSGSDASDAVVIEWWEKRGRSRRQRNAVHAKVSAHGRAIRIRTMACWTSLPDIVLALLIQRPQNTPLSPDVEIGTDSLSPLHHCDRWPSSLSDPH